MKATPIFLGLLAATLLNATVSAAEIGGKGKLKTKKQKTEEPTELFYADSCQFGNCQSGIGLAVNDQGDLFYGRWFRGKPHGFGTIYFNPDNGDELIPPGTLMVTRFADGMLDGVSTFDLPGGRKLSVKYKDSRDFSAFMELNGTRPQSIRYELPYQFEWEGRSIRREAFLRHGEGKRGIIEVHPYSDQNQCMYAIGESRGHAIPFLFDTGCSQTALSTNYIEYLTREGVHFTYTGTDMYETACGLIELRELVIEELTVGGVTFRNHKIGETLGGDNLLGMDIISVFGSFRISTDEHLLILE